jgi:hypothetical protein
MRLMVYLIYSQLDDFDIISALKDGSVMTILFFKWYDYKSWFIKIKLSEK